jgi:integrase
VAVVKFKTTVTPPRKTLTEEEKEIVKKDIAKKHPDFFRFMMILHYSGCRISELLRLKVKDVNQKEWTFSMINYKKKKPEYETRFITELAEPYWRETLKHATDPDHYIFSYHFLPGSGVLPRNYKKMDHPQPTMMDPHQVSTKWRK